MNSQLRRLALVRQGLWHAPDFGSSRQGTLNAIEHLGYVQIDTISMIERAHHHVLWTRVPDYQITHLNQLVAERQIFEYWFHAASYLPMRDYRFALRRMAAARNPMPAVDHSALMREILQRVRDEGPLRVRDLEGNKTKSGTWWDWGPSKRAVEKLFFQGDLMVSERIGMEKVFELRERILPSGLNLHEPDTTEYAAYLLRTYLHAQGVVTLEQLTHLHTDKPLKQTMRELLAAQIASGALSPIDGLPNAYAKTAELKQITADCTPSVHLLSPFDNAVIHRQRLQQLFGFDYRLECYVPAAKRQFGYFCLPILFGDFFVGRIDCKAHRKEQRLEVISLHLDTEPANSELFFMLLKLKLQQFAEFNGCDTWDATQITAAWRERLV